jgi:hypothetical protein
MFGFSEDFLRDFFKVGREPEWKSGPAPAVQGNSDIKVSATPDGAIVVDFQVPGVGVVTLTQGTNAAQKFVDDLTKAIKMARTAVSKETK